MTRFKIGHLQRAVLRRLNAGEQAIHNSEIGASSQTWITLCDRFLLIRKGQWAMPSQATANVVAEMNHHLATRREAHPTDNDPKRYMDRKLTRAMRAGLIERKDVKNDVH